MKWILIYFLLSNGVATGNVEFDNKDACTSAAKMLSEQSGWTAQVYAYCVPKG